MSNKQIKPVFYHLIALGVFLLLTAVYFTPVLSGKVASQHDMQQWKGAYQETYTFELKNNGDRPLWSGSMFGGMPVYTFAGVPPDFDIVGYVVAATKLGLPNPLDTVFLLMACFYVLMLSYRINPLIAILGSVAYAFSSYNFINLDAGHITKGQAIAYLPLIFAGLQLTFKENKWLGAVLIAFGCAMELYPNHIQITYYGFLLVIIWALVNLVTFIREKRIKQFIVCGVFAALGAGIGLGTGILSLMVQSEYQKETQRTVSELTPLTKEDAENRTDGLNKEYALEYSYTISEPLTILVPDLFGGASTGELGKRSQTYQTLKDNNVPEAQIKSFVANAPTYWGELRITAGPTYFGAIICFLFVLGLFLLKGPEKWWLLAGSMLAIMLSYGRFFPLLTDFFFDHVLYYNKFRAVTFWLVVPQLCFPVMGMLALREFTRTDVSKDVLKKGLLYSLYIIGGLLVILSFASGVFYDFTGPVDKQLPTWLLESMQEDRKAILRNDALRSLFFVAATFGGLWVYLNKKIKTEQLIIGLTVLVLVDLWMVDKRYFNSKDFISKSAAKQQEFPMTMADQMILRDSSLSYRVFNTSVSPFNDATTSYYHKSIGGYSAAKLRRYQDLIERQIGNQNMQVLNMLNTKYFIVNDSIQGPVAQQNPMACGNAWFVPEYKMVSNADSEMAALTNFDPRSVAFIDNRFKDYVNGFRPSFDPNATITLTGYVPDHLTYKSSASSEQFAVFSEIYYDKGWNAYIDGKPVEHIRVNYTLRGMKVPAGSHTIEYKFEPAVVAKAQTINSTFNILLGLSGIGGLVLVFVKRKKQVA